MYMTNTYFFLKPKIEIQAYNITQYKFLKHCCCISYFFQLAFRLYTMPYLEQI